MADARPRSCPFPPTCHPCHRVITHDAFARPAVRPEIERRRTTGRAKHFGFTTFDTEGGLLAALEHGDRHVIDGVSVAVNRAGSRPRAGVRQRREGNDVSSTRGTDEDGGGGGAFPEEKGQGPRLYVGGIDHDVHTEASLREHFSACGEVVDVYVPKDRHSGRRQSFCFVTFATAAAATEAHKRASVDLTVAGKAVEAVNVASERREHYSAAALSRLRQQSDASSLSRRDWSGGAGGWADDGAGGGKSSRDSRGGIHASIPWR